MMAVWLTFGAQNIHHAHITSDVTQHGMAQGHNRL